VYFEDFEKEVSLAVKRLPSKYRAILDREEIKIIPREKVPLKIREAYPGSIVFGVFTGTSLKDRSVNYAYPEPTRIEIYMESFENAYGNELSDKVRERIYRTVIHEIAHYFGFDEDEVRARGY